MPVELNIVESVTELDTTVVTVILESASEPGPAGPGVPVGGTVGQVLTKDSGTDYDTSWQDASGGGGGAPTDATYITQTANGTLSAEQALSSLATGLVKVTTGTGVLSTATGGTDYANATHAHAGEDITSGTVADARIASTIARDSEVTSAIATHEADTTSVHGIADTSALALTANVQPLDSDLTAIAALTTTAFGRGLLELANQAALLSAAGAAAASHTHAQADVTNLVTDLAAKQPLDSDLTAIAALTTTAFGRAFLAFADEAAFKAGVNLEAGTDFPSLTTFNDHSARHENGGADEISIAGLDGIPAELQTHLDDTTAHLASRIPFTPAGTIAATDVQAAIEEVASEAGGGSGAVSFIPAFFGGC